MMMIVSVLLMVDIPFIAHAVVEGIINDHLHSLFREGYWLD